MPSPSPPLDRRGRALAVGDWVRLVEIPPEVALTPAATRRVFARALGKTFRIAGWNGAGMAELDLSAKVARLETIWVEPEFLLRTRRAQAAHPPPAS